MAKKDTENVELDSFDVDDFDFDSDMMDPLDTKDDRNPSLKISSGAISGIKTAATSPNYYGGILKKALPDSYGEAFDVVDTVGSESVGLYNEAVRELKPAIKGVKRAARAVKPKLEPILPAWLSKKIDTLTKEEEEVASDPQVDANEAAINGAMLEVFQAQAKKSEEQEAKEEVRDAIGRKRDASTAEQIESIRTAMHRLVSYQDGITTRYQQKSLELQYRQYFATRDHLEISKATSTETLTLLKSVVKNTGLPDFVKMNTDEALKEQFRNKLVGNVQDYVSSGIQPFMRDLMGNVRERGLEKVRSFSQTVTDAARGAEELSEAGDMMAEMGIDGNVAAGEMIGKGAMDGAGNWLGKKLGGFLGKNKRMAGSGHALKRVLNSTPDTIRDWAEGGHNQFGIRGDVLDFVQSLVPQNSKSINLAESKLEDHTASAYWSNADSRSLQEVIPGMLSRIHQSSEGIRTGELPSLLTFDHGKSEFTTAKTMASRIRREVASEGSMNDLDYKTSQIIDLIDDKETLSPELRDKLRIKLLSDSTRKESFDIADYNSSDAFLSALGADDAERVAALFNSKVKSDEFGKTDITDVETQKNYTRLSQAYSGLRSDNTQSAKAAHIAAALGHKGILRDAGISSLRGNVDTFNNSYVLDAYKDYLGSDRNYEKSTLEASNAGSSISRNDANGLRGGGGMDGAVPTIPTTVMGHRVVTGSAQEQAESVVAGSEETPKSFNDYNIGRRRGRSRGSTANKDWESKLSRSDMFSDSSLDKLSELFEEHSSKPAAERTVSKLDEILEFMMSMNFGQGDGSGVVSGVGKTLGRFGAGIKDGVKSYVGGVNKMAKRLYSAPLKMVSKGWGLAKRGFEFASKKVSDVYVVGMQEAALTAAKMREGHYRNELTGEIITSVSDITGTVVDVVSGNVVITLEQFESGLFDKQWKKIKTSKLGRMASGAFKSFKGLAGVALAPMKVPGQVLSKAKELFFPPKDVYVAGESEPRLLGMLLQKGKYFSSLTGKPITSINMIDSDVKDGNGDVVLTLSDFKKGVVDSNGKPIEGAMKQVMSLIRKGVGVGVGAAKWGVDKVVGGVKAVNSAVFGSARWAKNKAAGMFTGGGFGINASVGLGLNKNDHQIEHINVTKKIYNLLRRQFGVEGSDLEMTVGGGMGSLGSGLKGKAAKVARRAKARKRLLARKLAGRNKVDATSLKQKAKRNARDAKAAALRKSRKSSRGYRGWKAKQQEKLSTIRKNGWRATLAARKNRVKDVVGAKIGKTVRDRSGFSGAIISGLLGITALMKSGLGKLGSLVKGVFGMRKILGAISAGKGVADMIGGADLPDGGKKTGKKGLGSKLWGGVKKYGGKALMAGASLAGTVSLSGIASGIATAGAAVASTIGAVVSAPVVIAAAAVAAVGVGGYYAYKYFKDKLKPLQKVRFTQYGLDLDDSDTNVLVGEIERVCFDTIEWSNGIPVNLNIDKKLETIYRMAGISLSDSARLQRFTSWFQSRFKPVYLSHIAMMKKYGNGLKLETIDTTLDDRFKADFAKGTRFGFDDINSPYTFSTHPLVGKKLVTGTDEIDLAIQEVVEEFGNGKSTKKRRPSLMDKNKAQQFKNNNDPKVQAITEQYERNKLLKKARGKYGQPLAPIEGTGVLIKPPRLASAPAPVAGHSYLGKGTEGGDGIYKDIGSSAGHGYADMVSVIEAAAEATGIHPSLLMAIAQAESSMNPKAKARTSSASGLFQFTKKTWRDTLGKFGDKYGIPKNASPMDPVASSLMAGELTRDNARIVETITGKMVGPGEAYMAHFLGASQGARLIAADADAIAAKEFRRAAKANPSIFYNADGSPKTVGEVREKLEGKVTKPGFMPNMNIAASNDGDAPLTDKSHTTAAPKLVAIDSMGRRDKMKLALHKPVGLASTEIRSQQRLLPTMNASETKARERKVEQVEQSVPVRASDTTTTRRAAEERKRREKIIQASGQQEELVTNGLRTIEILEESLAVQQSMDDSLREAVGHLSTLVGGAGNKPKPQTKTRQRNPVSLSKKFA